MRIVILFSLILCVFFSKCLSAQFSVHTHYGINNTDSPDFTNVANDIFFDQSLELGIAYWKRLENYRIEFHPGVSYGYYRDTSPLDASLHGVYLNLHTQVYPFDFQGDCDCPTFSKQGNFFSKGFFLFLVPSLAYHHAESNFVSPNTDTSFNYRLGLGTGLDIGLTDLITISPCISYLVYGRINFENFQAVDGIIFDPALGNSFGIRQIQLGFRLGFRPDYQKPRFR